MDLFVFLSVLFAAACHAGWNASIKRTLDPLATTVLIAIGAGLVALPIIPFAGWPELASWPWLIASIVIHLFYFAGPDRELSRRRSGAGLSDRAGRRAADDRRS